MAVRIIIDSTADMPKQQKEQCLVVPLTVHFGQAEYIDGVTIQHNDFYKMLTESTEQPTTSQASPAAFASVFQQVAEAGDQAVVITLASEFSGTYQSAMIAAQDYPGQIYVVDSQSAAIGTGILVLQALRLAQAGMDAPTLAAALEGLRPQIHVVALLDTLEYLKRGGRISKSVAFAGSLLAIKPVAAVRAGKIQLLGKARGSRQGNNLLVQEIEKSGGIDFEKPLLLGYTGLDSRLLEQYVQDSRRLWEQGTDHLETTQIGSVIGTHTGPGTVAVAFFSKA